MLLEGRLMMGSPSGPRVSLVRRRSSGCSTICSTATPFSSSSSKGAWMFSCQ